ncbi:MAG: HAMP domain-containing protein [Bryobacteraceae bacterium]|nr:HAMP domain-containing protein [Bryobacteraceae bacterium]
MSLVTKLMAALIVVVVVVAVISGVYTYKAEEKQLLKLVAMGADQLSRGLTSSTWHGMLADRRQDVYQVMETVALQHGIDRIRMFNRDGLITFSTREAEANTRVSTRHETCAMCHVGGEVPLDRVALSSRLRVMERSEGGRSLAIATPIYNEPSCSEASCHAHPATTKVLGVVEIDLDLAAADAELATIQGRVLFRVIVEAALICLLVYFFVRRFISKPIQQLIAGTQAVGQMDFAEPVPVPPNSGEVSELAKSFNVMRERLSAAQNEINEFTQRLETKVEARTRELKLAYEKLQQSDRLASLGQLSASVAHEINNPIAGVLNLAMLMQRVMKDDGVPPGRVADFRRYLSQVIIETSRVGRIVSDLLSFSRRSKPQRAESDLNEIIRATLSLASHKLKLSNVAVDLDLAGGLPAVLCDRSQIQQVALNLVMNAAEAMQGVKDGVLEIASGAASEGVVFFRVSDNGEGIPPESLPRIFDPFFTTKAEGKGVGLGLAVSYGIVQAHGGDIEAKNAASGGACFTVTLPVKGAPLAEEPQARVA